MKKQPLIREEYFAEVYTAFSKVLGSLERVSMYYGEDENLDSISYRCQKLLHEFVGCFLCPKKPVV